MSRSTYIVTAALLALLCLNWSCDGGPSDAQTEDVGSDIEIADVLDSALADSAESADSADITPAEPVYISSSADVDWQKSEVVYARGLSHEGEHNADKSEPMDLVGDLYVPQGIDGLRPALLIVHGGGFIFGSRTQPELVEFAEYFASRGWLVLSIDYRLAEDYGTVPKAWIEAIEKIETNNARIKIGKAIYPTVRDAKAAARWLWAKADEYDVSTEHIAVMGGSAGAHTSVALGVTDPADFRDELTKKQDPTLESTNLDQTGRVAAVLDFWGGTEAIRGVHEAFGGESRWDAADAPMLIVHGTEDNLVSFDQAKTLRKKFRQTGVSHKFVKLEGAGHGPWDETVGGRNLREIGHAFLREHLKLRDRSNASDR